VKEGTRFYRCRRCGTYVSAAPYLKEIYEYAGPDESDGVTGESVLARRGFRWSVILADIMRVAPPPATLLDVGTGKGGFVRLARDRGYDAEGVTMSDKEVAFARRHLGIPLRLGTLDAVDTGEYDVVCANNVIEHVPDPGRFLGQMAARTRPGGLVAVTTPSTRSYQRLLLGARRWRMVRSEHLSVLSPAGLHGLALACGLEPVLHVTTSVTFRGLRRLGPVAHPVRRFLFAAIRLAGVGGDQTLIARKPS